RAWQEERENREERERSLEGEVRNLTRLLDKERGSSSQLVKELTQEKSRGNILRNEKECLESELSKLRRGL
ncbi:unnamed protein product, partial [Sphagnum balticum]